MNQTVYVKIPSNNIHLHRNEREMLDRSRPGPSAAEQAIERSLLEQVAGQPKPAATVSPQLAAQWATRKQPSRRETELEIKLFEQISASGFQPPTDE